MDSLLSSDLRGTQKKTSIEQQALNQESSLEYYYCFKENDNDVIRI